MTRLFTAAIILAALALVAWRVHRDAEVWRLPVTDDLDRDWLWER